jgi:hypothetical protein
VFEEINRKIAPTHSVILLMRVRVPLLTPRLFNIILKRITNRRTVQEALTDRRWILDITGSLSVGVLVDYLHLWNLISDFELLPDTEDKHTFNIAANGAYSWLLKR